MYQDSNEKRQSINVPQLNIIPTNDFEPTKNKKRPGGSSFDVQFFTKKNTGSLWIGKCGERSALRNPYVIASKKPRNYDEYREWLGLALNELFGIDTPKVCLSVQKLSESIKNPGLSDTFNYSKPCLHIMTQFIKGYTDQGENFIKNYKLASTLNKSFKVFDKKLKKDFVLKGFGASLAVSCFINDYDCIGRSGGNIGYVIQQNSDTNQLYAKTVKIDPGEAFGFFESECEEFFKNDPRSRRIQYSTKKPDRLTYLELTNEDKVDFAETAKRILKTPRNVFAKVIQQVVRPDGFTQQMADQLLDALMARKSLFVSAYAPELDSQLKDEINDAKMRVLRKSLQNVEEKQEPIDIKTIGTINEWQLKVLHAHGQYNKSIAENINVFQCPPADTHFIGRSQALLAIDRKFNENHHGVSLQVIHGLGGIGKTALANAYVQANIDKQKPTWLHSKYDHVIWLSADLPMGMQLKKMAIDYCGVSDECEESQCLISLYLYLRDKKVLMVVDNEESYDEILPFLPKSCIGDGYAHVLITSRHDDWPKASTIKLTHLTEEEGLQYIKSRLKDYHIENVSVQEMKALYEALEGIPITLTVEVNT